MPTPNKNTLLRPVFWGVVAACLLSACQKEKAPAEPTIFNITVVDSKSGKVVPGAIAFLNTVVTDQHDWSTLKTETFIADNKGKFTITIPADRSMSSFTLTASGYLTRIRFVKTQANQTDVEIPLIPTDAILKLTIENKTGLTNQFYMAATSPTALKELGRNYALHDLIVDGGTQSSYIWRFPSEEYATLYFGTSNFIKPVNFSLAKKQDSVFLKPNDTTFYKISF